MADDRPLESPDEALRRLTADLADLQSTLTTRLTRRPVGDIEETLRVTPKDGTLFLQGQTISRTVYTALWAWVQSTGAGGFGTGDGVTTFTLPDFRGRVLRGATSTAAAGELLGRDSDTLTTGQLPSHNHGNTGGAGAHGPHPTFPIEVQAGPGATGVWAGGASANNAANHTHGTGNTGNGDAIDFRQASVGVNVAIWV